MAFVIRDAKIISDEGLFSIVKARFYILPVSLQFYKKAKLVNIGVQVVQEEEPLPQHYFSGSVVENVYPVNRVINIHRRDTGELVGSTTSSGIGGYFYVETTYSGPHYAVCIDDSAGLDYNDLIYGNIFPATISG